MIDKNSILNVSNKNIGYFISRINERDHIIIFDLIKSHFEDILEKNNLNSKNINFDNYLNSIDKEKHSKLLIKKNRILSQNYFDEFVKQVSLIKKIKSLYNDITITDEENLGYGNIYWRLVRPHPYKDVGPFHKDKWGWDLSNYKIDNTKYQRFKIWISIIGKDRLGFRFVKNSINNNYNFITKEHSKKSSFSFRNLVFDEKNLSKDEIISLKGEKGTFIMFNDELLHTGEILHNNSVRLSIEFTLLLPVIN